MPSTDPPIPILPSSLATDLSGCSWAAVHNNDQAGGQVGRFSNGGTVYHLCPVHDASGPDGAWAVTTSPPTGVKGILFTSGDATKLLNGTVQTNGTITYSSVNYSAKLYGTSSEFILKLV